MVSSRSALQAVTAHVDESMGIRSDASIVGFTPVTRAQDIGRVPLRTFGRVEIDLVVPDSRQPREDFNEEEIQHLAASIRDKGQLHPIRVRWNDDLEKWIIVTGERRWRATKAAGLSTIDCFFHDEELSPSEILEQQLVENLLRQDLKPMEEARGFSKLMEMHGWNGRQLAEALRITPSRVSRALALLDLPPEIQECVDSGTLPKTSAYELSKLPDDSARLTLADQASARELTQKQTAAAVRRHRGKPKRKAKSFKQTFMGQNGLKVTVTAQGKTTYRDIEEALRNALEEVRYRIEKTCSCFDQTKKSDSSSFNFDVTARSRTYAQIPVTGSDGKNRRTHRGKLHGGDASYCSTKMHTTGRRRRRLSDQHLRLSSPTSAVLTHRPNSPSTDERRR